MNKNNCLYLVSIFILLTLTNKINANNEDIEFKIVNAKLNETKDTLHIKLNIMNHSKTNYIVIFDDETFIKNGLFQIKFINSIKSLNIINFRETYKISKYNVSSYILTKYKEESCVLLNFFIYNFQNISLLDSNYNLKFNLNFYQLKHLCPMYIENYKVDLIENKLYWKGTEIYTGKIKLDFP